ncbi:MAG: hypothetical protein QOF30_3531 [Acidimicrobiaceae bacterium]|nr:hypothetical protein [Acidimicrobiaceae bacterium]
MEPTAKYAGSYQPHTERQSIESNGDGGTRHHCQRCVLDGDQNADSNHHHWEDDPFGLYAPNNISSANCPPNN